MTETKEKTSNFDQPLYENAKIPSSWINRYTGEVMPDKSPEQQKFEEIKKMAWELNLHSSADRPMNIEDCWKEAESFYEHAKTKEKEMGK